MLSRFIEKEFQYDGINVESQCFEFTKRLDWGLAVVCVYDDDYIVGRRFYSDKKTSEYLISSTAHLLSLILELPETWESQQNHCSHESLTTTQLRKLILNAPSHITKTLRSHPQYDTVMRQISSLVDKVKRFDEVSLLIADIRKLSTTDPYRAFGEALKLSERIDSVETQQLLDETHSLKESWGKRLERAIQKGQEGTRNEVDRETYQRIAKALRWTENHKQGVAKPEHKEIRLMQCDGAAIDKKICASRVDKLVKHYGKQFDSETLTAIVVYCDENNETIDLTRPLEDQFDVED
jgi:hypothetical protein